MTMTKTVDEIANECMGLEDKVNFAKEVMHLSIYGVWQHAPVYNKFRAALLSEGYSGSIVMSVCLEYIKGYALMRLALS